MRYYGSIILQPVMGEVMPFMFDPVGEEPADPEEEVMTSQTERRVNR